MESLDLLLPALLDALNAPSERVVVESLTVQALIAEDDGRFRQLMHLLLDRLHRVLLSIDYTFHIIDIWQRIHGFSAITLLSSHNGLMTGCYHLFIRLSRQ